MQFVHIKSTDKLSDLAKIVGYSNVAHVVSANGLDWTPNIGQAFQKKCQEVMNASQSSRSSTSVSWEQKRTILNTMTQDDDVFETAALMSESGWRIYKSLNTFPNMLKVPDTIKLPDSSAVIGSGVNVSESIHSAVMTQLETVPHSIDPSLFNNYSSAQNVKLPTFDNGPTNVALPGFKIPWGDITLHSSLSDESIDFPVYPKQAEDGVKANFTQMPELLMQYEPWQLYQSSGPRANVYEFHMHRDMWSWNHLDGKANELVRFCEANCYPEYNGSLVNVSTVTLYVKGKTLISGVMTDVNVTWDGPIGQDGWYLNFTLTLSITEVAKDTLNYSKIKNKPLIGY